MSAIPLLLLLVLLFPPRNDAWFGCADDLWPEELRIRRKSGGAKQNPFFIEVRDRESNRETFVYSRRKEFNVRIRGGPFSWAEIHARSVLFPHVVVGEFVEPPPTYFHIRDCAGRNRSSAVTLADARVSRHHGAFHWIAPPSTHAGPLVIVARIVENGTSYLVQSPFLTPIDAQFDDASGCGEQYGCARIGKKHCVFGESCRISIRWRCFRNSVLVEASLRGHSTASFGLTTGRRSAAMCTATSPSGGTPHVSFRGYYLSRHHGFPLNSPNVTFLRGTHNSHVADCRFEIPRPIGKNPSIIYGKVDIYGHPVHLTRQRLKSRNFCDPYAYPVHRSPPTFLSLANLASTASTVIAQLPAIGFALLPLVPLL